MNIIETGLQGCVIIEPKVYGDDRGFFLETYHALGIPIWRKFLCLLFKIIIRDPQREYYVGCTFREKNRKVS